MKIKNATGIAAGLLLPFLIQAQSLQQIIRGKVVDADSRNPLIGVTLYIEGSNPLIGTVTNKKGEFEFSPLVLGRYNVAVSYVGYEQKIVPNILLGAGKEAYLNIELTEEVNQMNEVVVAARKNKGEPLNEMACVSARSVTVEETQRFAGSFNDPSRMASSYAGVMGDPDGNNDIIIRGNSPRGLLWRLEGIDIPNPNHFAEEGSTGGPISILNTETLDNSDFFTGAYPSDYGNSYSGVFDIHLRKGNDHKPEFTGQVGIIGCDLSAEGPFSSVSSASYLINYRYSSLAMLNAIGIKVAGDAVPKFQDMTFNINVPTKKAGTFQLFGLGGLSSIVEADTNYHNEFSSGLSVMGLNHIYPLGEKTYLSSSLAFTGTLNKWEYSEHETEPDQWTVKGRDGFYYQTYMGTVDITHKFSAMHTLKAGVNLEVLGYNLNMDDYDEDAKQLYRTLNDKGQSELLQSFINWKFRPVTALTFNTGLHYQYFRLNGHYSIEPRFGVRWQFTPRQALGAGFGVHSKVDNVSLYLLRERQDDGTLVQNNKDLDFLKARHYVLSYENRLTRDLNLKVETYFQDLYNVPVGTDSGSVFSILNSTDGYIITKLSNKGTGKNYGVEVTLEKYYANHYYFMVSGSVFESKYIAIDGVERNTRFNNNFVTNALAGKEFIVGKKKNSAIDLNIRATYAGGLRYTPIDAAKSMEKGYTVRDNSKAFAQRRPDYMRIDCKVSYRRNKKNTTRVWELDVENVTNRLNTTGDWWNNQTQQVESWTQMGLLPTINYRIEF